MATYTYPGIYVEEVPSGVHAITGVSTADTAFIDFFPQGPLPPPPGGPVATRITSFESFKRQFGGLDARSEASYAIQQFYLNGGSVAWVVRVAAGAPAPATLELSGGSPAQHTLQISAASPGLWGLNLQVAVDWNTPVTGQFNLVVRQRSADGTSVVASEIHRNLSMDTTSANFVGAVVGAESALITAESVGTGAPPTATGGDVTQPSVIGDASDRAHAFDSLGGAPSDGQAPDATALEAGLSALDGIAPYIFNLLCVPRAAELDAAGYGAFLDAAIPFCQDRRAFFIVDIPSTVQTPAQMVQWGADNDTRRSPNAAVYFPRLEIPDPLNANRPRNVGASGTLAGVYARTDSARGVYKAPAGIDATLVGATLPTLLTDLDNGGLNTLGLNGLRTFPIYGSIAWGARTLEGADQIGSEWKYVPVRRTALFIEETLFESLKWVVFEPNDEPLWSEIRLNVGSFMQDLFRNGYFEGQTPNQAYFVKCDSETTTQTDINNGIVNIMVGFAPLSPAEFVVLKIEQLAGQTQA